MLHHRLRLSVSVLSGLLALGSALAQPVERTETESIWPDTGYLWRDYGAVMAADGDHLVFSLKNPADGSDGGSVVFMNKAGGVWTEVTSYGGPSSSLYFLGAELAVKDDRTLAQRTNLLGVGEVLFYRYNPVSGAWDSTTFIPLPPGATEVFGQSLAISGAYFAIGDSIANRVWVYKDTGDSVLLVEEIAPPSGSAISFGYEIAMDGNCLFIGDPDDGEGRVDVYESMGGAYAHLGPLDLGWLPYDEGDRFGSEIAVDGETLVVSAPFAGVNFGGGFAIFSGTAPDFIPVLSASVPFLNENFPASLDVAHDMVIVGRPDPDGIDPGQATIYRSKEGLWQGVEILELAVGASGAGLGTSVAFSADDAFVGAPFDTIDILGAPIQAGRIARFSQDCDGDGILNHIEIAEGTASDYNQNGLPDDCDSGEYIIVPRDYPTIQAAVNAAAGTTVLIDAGVYSEFVVIDGFDADIRALNPASPPVLNAYAPETAALTVGNGSVSLEDIAFEGCYTGIQGFSGAVLSVNGCSFRMTSGGINLDESNLTADGCIFENNTSVSHDSGAGGAAIYAVESTLVLLSSDFISNGGNSPNLEDCHNGGAIYMGDCVVTANQCLFENNSAQVDYFTLSTGANSMVRGGAISMSLIGTSSFTQCSFVNNYAYCGVAQHLPGSPANNIARSGAVYCSSTIAPLQFVHCLFDGNEARALNSGGYARAAAADLYVHGSIGGGADSIFLGLSTVQNSRSEVFAVDGSFVPMSTPSHAVVFEDIRASVTSTDFINLPTGGLSFVGAPGDGDARLIATVSNFTDCDEVEVYGGSGGSTVTSCDFTGTRLSLRDGILSSCDFYRVGSSPVKPQFAGPQYALELEPGAAVTNCTFHQVYCDYVIGGGTIGNPLLVSFTTICGNDAPAFESNDLWVNDGNTTLEGGGNDADSCGAPTDLHVPGDYGSIADAIAVAGNGDSIVLGSGTYAESVDLRGFSNVIIRGDDGANAVIQPPAGSSGIRLNGAQGTVSNLTITDATTGIDVESGSFVFDGVDVFDSSGDCGGAIRVGSGLSYVDGDSAAVVLLNSTLQGNSATDNGGGICVLEGASCSVDACVLESNTADNDGGGMYAADGASTLLVQGSTLRFNIALNDGGAVRLNSANSAELVSNTLQGNSSGRFGGGAAVAEATVVACGFVGNSASAIGGGMRSTGTSFVENCSFQSNVAALAGGLAATAIETYVENFTSCGNSGGEYYGNLVTSDGALLYCSDDCNANGVPDSDEIESGLAADCNGNNVPDECEDLADVDGNGIPDACDPNAGGRLVVLGSLGSVVGLPIDAIDLLARPLFRSTANTHDILVLSPNGDGELDIVSPDLDENYALQASLSGASFERCCDDGVQTVCLNNGPAGGSSIDFARGDVVISHLQGNTGLFDEELEMYYGCNAQVGLGDPQTITDYELAPDAANSVSALYLEEEEGQGGLAKAAAKKKKQLVVSKKGEGSAPQAAPVSARHGSGQGGTGPYPGEDTGVSYPSESDPEESYSLATVVVGDFNGDGNDDLLALHPTEQKCSVRNFESLADYVDESGQVIPCGANWSAPVYLDLSSVPLDAIVGDFIDLPGTDDDDLDDVFIIEESEAGVRFNFYVCASPNALIYYAGFIADFENVTLAQATSGINGDEIAMFVARSAASGMASLFAFAQDENAETMVYSSKSLVAGVPRAVSCAPMRFGASPRQVVAVLIETIDDSEVHLLEIGERPPAAPPVNDECEGAIALLTGANAFDTTGATDSDAPLDESCHSEGQVQPRADLWYSWTATATGEALVSTCGSASFDTWLVAYEVDCAGDIVGCNDESDLCPNFTSRMTFAATEGVTYLIRVGAWGFADTGSGTLTIAAPYLPADLNLDGLVNGADLALLLGSWGAPGLTDLNGDGTTDGADLTFLLSAWSL